MLLASLISGFSVFEIRPENHQKLPNDNMVEMKKIPGSIYIHSTHFTV